MSIEFSEVIKQGGGTLELDVLNPSTSGAVASISTIATAIDNTQWVKVGAADTDWRQFLIAEEDGTFSANIELVEVFDIITPINVLGAKHGKPTIGDGALIGGVPIAMQSDLPIQTFIGTATNTIMVNSTTLTSGDVPTTPTSLHIGQGVTSISSYAFSYKSTIVGSLTFPDSVTSIGSYAFSGCSGFNGSLTIGNSVTTIGNSTFHNCSGLISLTIGNSVTSIGSNAFYNCSAFIGDLTIPDSVETIGSSAFYNITFSGDLTIGNSVTSIGSGAFYYVQGLTNELVLPNSLITIGSNAFYAGRYTGTLTIGNSVETIGDTAFKRCNTITNVTIPPSVTSVGSYSFAYCDALDNVDCRITKTIFDASGDELTFSGVTTIHALISDGTWSIGGGQTIGGKSGIEVFKDLT